MNGSPKSVSWNEIHLWVCSGVLSPELDRAVDFIAPEEQERARRYRFDRDRRRYVGGVLLQRQILSRYLSCSPDEISFVRNQWGKPSLGREHESAIEFSLSRSHQIALLAVCTEAEVGVDLEYGCGRNAQDLGVTKMFCRDEQHFVLEAFEPTQAFFEIWARKEAYIKGIGRGLSHPLGEFDITPDEPMGKGLVRDWSSDPPSHSWQVRSIKLSEDGYGAAVASPLASPSIELVELRYDELLAALGQ